MATHDARVLYETLTQRVRELLAVGTREEASGALSNAESTYRACVVLTVAAFDAFMHEKGTEVFTRTLRTDPQIAPAMASYLGQPAAAGGLTVSDPTLLIRYCLSFKTMTTPGAIDKAIEASGQDPNVVWKNAAIAQSSREQRMKNTLSLQCDRRNLIAHEGDWDPVQLALRHIAESHVLDCIGGVGSVVSGFDTHWN
jgi:hypothetical protein